jgi:uncharacterized membrane protein
VQEKTAEEVINVFVPTTPNPTWLPAVRPEPGHHPPEDADRDGLKLVIFRAAS